MWLRVILLSFVLVSPAHAITITIEPDDYTAGTNVSTLFRDLTMYRMSSFEGANSLNLYNNFHVPLSPTPLFTPIFIETRQEARWIPPTGDQSFGSFRRPSDAAFSSNFGVYSAMMIQFNAPVNYFEIAGSWNSDEQQIWAFDANNQLLNLARSRTWLWGYDPVNGLDSPAADVASIGSIYGNSLIRTVFVGGWENPATLDTMRYNKVPEPSSLLLLALGVVFATTIEWRRRRTKS